MPKQLSSTEYTAFCKRLQSALKRREVVVSLSSIKESIADLVDSYDNELNEQVQQVCLDALLKKHVFDTLREQPNGVVVTGEGEDLEQGITERTERSSLVTDDNDSKERSPTPSNTTELGLIQMSEDGKREIVTSKAAEMSIELSADDVAYVASQIDDNTLEDVLAQTENLLCAYADYKKAAGLEKIDAMFGRVYNHVQQNNQETSNHISQGLRRFGQDIERSQQDFKSSALSALEHLKVPTA